MNTSLVDRTDPDLTQRTIGINPGVGKLRLGLTNARLEGLHNKIRLLCHRSYGFHSPQALIALIYLCCAGITITPPHR